MNREPTEIVSAFLDGESVSSSDLAEALAAPGAADALRDFVRIRAIVFDDSEQPSPRFVRRVRAALARERAGRRWAFLVRWIAVPAPALAAALVLAVGLGAFGALWLRHDATAEARPPKPVREIAFVLDANPWWEVRR